MVHQDRRKPGGIKEITRQFLRKGKKLRRTGKEGRKWRKRDARVRKLAEDVARDSVGKLCMGVGVGR